MPTQVLTAEQKKFIVASNMEGVTDGEVVDSFLELKSNQYASAPIGATRVATRGNTSGNCYGTITPWVATSNWTVEFDVIFAPTAVGDRYFLDAPSDGSNRFALYTNTSGKLQWTTSGDVTVYVDDVQITNSAWSHPIDGVIRKVKIVGVGRQVGFGTILSRYSNTQNSESILFNLRLTDLTTPANSRFYPMDGDGSSSVITNSSANAQHGTWYNRTSGDVVTVYPDAIKPGQEFWFAFRYKVTDVSQNSGYNYLLSLGSKASGKSGYLIYLPESNGQFGVDQFNNNVRTVVHFGKDFGTTHLDGLTHTAVIHVKTDGSFEYWVDSETPKYSAGTFLPAFAMEYFHLNGYRGNSGASASRMGANINYFFIYNSLDPSDIPYILQGDNPALFGEVRQGYLLNGDTSEILNQEPLTLYPVEEPPKFQDVVRNLIKSWFTNMMGWIT